MPTPRTHRLLILGADRVGKTAIIEQLIFGNHVIGQVNDTEYYTIRGSTDSHVV